MKVKELKKIGINKLEEYKVDDVIYKAEKLLQYVLNINKVDLIINDNRIVDSKSEKRYLESIEEMIQGKPLQYITHMQEFMKLNFYVDENVLIPQPDTEILVEKVINIIKMDKSVNVLDLCTGSGAIAVSIKKYMEDANVYASDVSKDALNIAKLNAKNNNANIYFIKSNMFENIKDLKFDIIVSNPPYIETRELEKLPKDVQHEPTLALDGGEDGLKFYKIIRDEGYKFLNDNGKILIEIGYNQNKSVTRLFEEDSNYKNMEVYKDLLKIDRVIKIEKS